MNNLSDCKEGLLSSYRVLHLASEKGVLCGKILGDFGAGVIVIEPPGGTWLLNRYQLRLNQTGGVECQKKRS